MDLSKAFATINNELLIAKLHAYSFNKESLERILDYLSNRWQRTKIWDNFSPWAEILQRVPQGLKKKKEIKLLPLCAISHEN